MKKIVRILNHNSVIIHDQESNLPKLVLETGIGFGRKVNEYINIEESSTVYILQEKYKQENVGNLIQKIDPIYLEISSEILEKTKQQFEVVDTEILLPLADHIAFAISRIKKEMIISNPFSNEIRHLYSDEYEIAKSSVPLIQKKTGILINDEEVGYITLHIHSAIDKTSDDGMAVAMIISDSIGKIAEEYQKTIDVNSASYSRLMIHMKYLLVRLQKNEVVSLDMEDYTKSSIPRSYKIAETIIREIEETLKKPIPKVETGYLAMHIERILN